MNTMSWVTLKFTDGSVSLMPTTTQKKGDAPASGSQTSDSSLQGLPEEHAQIPDVKLAPDSQQLTDDDSQGR